MAANVGIDPKQYIESFGKLGNFRAVARAFGVNESTVRRAIRAAESRGEHLSDGARGAMERVGLTGTEMAGGWIKTKFEDGTAVSVRFKTPDLAADDQLERIRAAFVDLPAATPVPAPLYSDDDLLTLYPIADAHVGMLAWGEETGEDYDTRIACDRLRSWVGQCVASAPPSGTGVILVAGDLLHADDQTSQTPKSRHVLDVDSRHFRTIDMAINALAACVDLAAAKHSRVIVRILPGNHDPHASLPVLFALAERYRDSPRVDVDKRPGEYWVFEHGSVLLASHHGDKAPPERLAMGLISEHREAFGRSKFCHLFTGHLHSFAGKDIGGVRWEQLRAVTARDAYAASHSWVSQAELQAITYHRERGEIARCRVAA